MEVFACERVTSGYLMPAEEPHSSGPHVGADVCWTAQDWEKKLTDKGHLGDGVDRDLQPAIRNKGGERCTAWTEPLDFGQKQPR